MHVKVKQRILIMEGCCFLNGGSAISLQWSFALQVQSANGQLVFTLKLAKVHYYYASFPIPHINFLLTFIGGNLTLSFIFFPLLILCAIIGTPYPAVVIEWLKGS